MVKGTSARDQRRQRRRSTQTNNKSTIPKSKPKNKSKSNKTKQKNKTGLPNNELNQEHEVAEILASGLSNKKFKWNHLKPDLSSTVKWLGGIDHAPQTAQAGAVLKHDFGHKCLLLDRDLLEWAQENHVMGRERTSYQMSAHHEKIVAHHEAGHALVACLTPSANTVHKMTIVPRQKSLGHVMLLPTEDTLLPSRSELLAQLDVAMGGRIAEELLLGIQHITTGATGDLQAATRVARNMVTKYGMTLTTNQHNLCIETRTNFFHSLYPIILILMLLFLYRHLLYLPHSSFFLKSTYGLLSTE